MPKIILEKLYPDAKEPTRGTDGAAGYDVCAHLTAQNPGKLFGADATWLSSALSAYGERLVDAAAARVAARLGSVGTVAAPGFHEIPVESARVPGFWSGGIEIPPGFRALIPTGLKMAIPPGWEVQVRPRSGLALKEGITVLNAPGTIDSDYRGELGVILLNTSSKLFSIRSGDRIAQLVALPTFEMRFEEGSVCDDTDRGDGGFGSTGTA